MDPTPHFAEPIAARPRPARPGTVYLVGAGPGDPELLTLRAAHLLGRAQAIVYDHLISPAILDLANPDAERLYAGKERGNHSLPQEELNVLLVRLAREGKIVVRLKGGDPYIFGRGGEEAETLADHGIPFEVVPGVTAAAGVAAYSGIPLTHRAYASSCVLAAGYLKDGTVDLDWEGLARSRRTIVIYMGLHGLQIVSEKLVEHGLAPRTPAAIVQHGTLATQRVVTGTLGDLPDLARSARLKPPTLVIIGEIVALREKLDWFAGLASEASPLANDR